MVANKQRQYTKIEKIREERKRKSRIDFIITNSDFVWFPVERAKLIGDHQVISVEWKVNINNKQEDNVAMDCKKITIIVEACEEKYYRKEAEK